MDKRISELVETLALQSNDFLVLQRSSANFKISKQNLETSIAPLPSFISITYSAFKALSGSYVTMQPYNVTDVANVLGFGVNNIFRLLPKHPADQFIMGIDIATSKRISIDVSNDVVSLIESDIEDKRVQKYFNILPPVIRTIIGPNDVIIVNSDEQAVVFGNSFTNNGTITINGTGKFIIINGGTDKVLRFDADGFPTESPIRHKTSGVMNVPQQASDPATPEDQDFWILNNGAGSRLLKYKDGGVVYFVELTS